MEERYKLILDRLALACQKVDRDPSEVELLAVSKNHSLEKIRELVELGHSVFGESRQQEAISKIGTLPGNLRWHFIGRLQKNKIRKILPYFDLIQSVDSVSTAVAIDRIAEEMGLFPQVLLQVNLAEESSKIGLTKQELFRELEVFLGLKRLQIQGLMTFPPWVNQAEKSRKWFVELREIKQTLEEEYQLGLPELSMGMSLDFEVAIEEGATIIRVGSALFGKR